MPFTARYIAFISGLFLGLSAFGQEELRLSEAIAAGLENNYQIRIAERDIDIAANNNDWSIAGRYPSIDLSLNSNNGYTNLDNPASFLRESSSASFGLSPGIEASWVLFDGYRVKFTKRQLEELEHLSRGNAQLAVENTIQSIILAYYQVLVQEEQLKVLEEVLGLSRDRVDYQRVKREFGQAGSFDILQTQDAYLNDSTSYLVQKNTLENAMRSLKLTMGVEAPGKLYVLADKLDFIPREYTLEALNSRMLANNKSLQNLFVNRELSLINSNIQESARYPTLSLRSGASYNVGISSGTQTFIGREPNDIPEVAARTVNVFFNLSASYNLFDGGAKKRRIENARVEEMIAQLNIEDMKRRLSTQLENTLATYDNQKRLVELTTKLIDNARQNLEIADERFKGGLISSFDYRTIQLSYINASQSRLNAIFNLKNTETELIRLIGGLVR